MVIAPQPLSSSFSWLSHVCAQIRLDSPFISLWGMESLHWGLVCTLHRGTRSPPGSPLVHTVPRGVGLLFLGPSHCPPNKPRHQVCPQLVCFPVPLYARTHAHAWRMYTYVHVCTAFYGTGITNGPGHVSQPLALARLARPWGPQAPCHEGPCARPWEASLLIGCERDSGPPTIRLRPEE